MQVSVERQEGLERTLKVEIPSDRIEGAVNQAGVSKRLRGRL